MQECVIPGWHGYHAYHCYNRAFVNDVAVSLSLSLSLSPCLWGYRAYPGYMAIRVPWFRFVIAPRRDFHVFRGTEMYC